MSRQGLTRAYGFIAVAACSYLSYVFLYFLRTHDDNRLTSWERAFEFSGAWPFFVLLALMLVLAFILSEHRLPGPRGLFVLAFALGASFWREPEVIVDASRYFTQAKHLSEYGIIYFLREWGHEIVPWTDMPFAPFVYGLAMKLFGESRTVIQAINTAMFAGSATLTAMLGRELLDLGLRAGHKEYPSEAGSFVLAAGYLYTQVPILLVDVASMFVLTLSFYSYAAYVRHGGRARAALSAASMYAAFFTKYSLWMMLSCHALLMAVLVAESPARAPRRTAAVLAVFLIAAGGTLYCYRDVMASQMKLLIEYQKPGLGRWMETYASTLFFQVHPVLTVSAAASALVAVLRRDWRYVAIAWLIILMFALGIQRSRYVIPIIPMLALMGAYGLSAIVDARLRRFAICAACVSAFILAQGPQMAFLERNNLINLKLAGEHLDEMDISEYGASEDEPARVITTPQLSIVNPAVTVPMLDMYTKRRLVYDYVRHPLDSEQEILTSSFRFTWDYSNPRYYQYGDGGAGMGGEAVAVVISSYNDRRLRLDFKGYKLIRKYNVNEGHYRFKPFVNIYAVPPGEGNRGTKQGASSGAPGGREGRPEQNPQ